LILWKSYRLVTRLGLYVTSQIEDAKYKTEAPRVTVATASVVYWSEFLATDPEVPGSILGPTRFSEK
jgi:hypothetical protein